MNSQSTWKNGDLRLFKAAAGSNLDSTRGGKILGSGAAVSHAPAGRWNATSRFQHWLFMSQLKQWQGQTAMHGCGAWLFVERKILAGCSEFKRRGSFLWQWKQRTPTFNNCGETAQIGRCFQTQSFRTVSVWVTYINKFALCKLKRISSSLKRTFFFPWDPNCVRLKYHVQWYII